MKKFLLKIFFFIIPIILLIYPIDLLISYRFKKLPVAAGEIQVWSDIFESKINTDIAIYGSSRAWKHFNPKIFEKRIKLKTYNFGIDGHHLGIQLLRHKQYFKYNSYPKLIIYSLSMFLLEKRKDLFKKKQFLPFLLNNKDFYHITKQYKGFNKLDYFIPLYRYAGISKVFINNPTTDRYRYKGFKGQEIEWNSNLSIINNFSININSNYITMLDNFVKKMKSKNISVIFVYSPEYTKGQNKITNRKQIMTIFDTISRNNKIPFFNYSDSTISKKRKYFYNTHHLNKKGANLFTNKFISDLLNNMVSKSLLDSIYITKRIK